jgi:hypothetical protein
MSTKPQSVNDETPIAKRIRRDQFKRVKGIIDANRSFPIIALGLVRDYFKGNSDIRSIYFDNPDSPKEIIVSTHSNKGIGGTEYHYSIQRPIRLETPTL